MHTDIATRAFVVALKSSGGKTTPEVAEATGLPLRTVNHIYARAIQRGFDPNHRPIVIKDEYLRDAPRSGRPSRQSTEAVQNTVSLPSRLRGLRDHCVAYPTNSWVQKDEADEEAWVDEEDEGGTA